MYTWWYVTKPLGFKKVKPAMILSTTTMTTRKFYIKASQTISVIAVDGRTNSKYFMYITG
jgi:hypothetical protein